MAVDVDAGAKRTIATSDNGYGGDDLLDLGQLSVSPDGSQVLATREERDKGATDLSVFSTSSGDESH